MPIKPGPLTTCFVCLDSTCTLRSVFKIFESVAFQLLEVVEMISFSIISQIKCFVV